MSGDELEPESLFILRLPPVSNCIGIDDLVMLQFSICIRHTVWIHILNMSYLFFILFTIRIMQIGSVRPSGQMHWAAGCKWNSSVSVCV